MTDYEILEANILEHAGLADAPVEEMTYFIQEFTRLVAICGLLRAGENLAEKDQEIFSKLLEQEEAERAEAFLSSRGIDLNELVIEEAIRIKRPIIESGKTLNSIEELIVEVKVQLYPDALAADILNIQTAINEALAYIESLPISDEMKERLAKVIEDLSSQEVEEQLSELLPPNISEEVDRLMDQEKIGEALILMLQHGVDFVELSVEAVHYRLEKLKGDVKSFEEIIGR